MADVKNKTVNIYIDQTAAVSALENLQVQADKLTTKIKEGRQAGKAMTTEIKKLSEVNTSIQSVQDQIDKGLRPSMVQTQNEVTKLRNELKRMSEDAPGYAEKFQAYQKARTELDRLSQSINGVAKAQTSWLQEAKVIAFGVLIGNTVQSAIQAIGGYFSGIVSGNAKMSDSLAKVRQTTGLTADEVKNLQTQLKGIDTRTAQSDLLKIAEIGGQFNVPKEQLKGFVEQVDRVNVVLGSEFGGGAEQITTEMALLRNVFTDIKSDHIDKDIGNIANAVVTLAQEGAATAPVISDFAKRLSPLIATAHITSGEILGLGATMQELAVNPERGGTAVVKLFDKMISNADAFAKVAGVGVDDFKKQLQSDTWGAFLKVLEGFKKGGDNVLALNSTIQDLETSGVGAKEVLVKLSQNTDLLKSRSDLASESLLKQNKITEQFAISNNNLAGETDKLNKKLGALLQSKSLSDFFSAGIQVISKFIDVIRAIPNYISENKTAFTLLAIGIATMNASYIQAAILIARDTALKIYNAAVTRLTAGANTLAIASQAAYIQISALLTGQITIATAAQRLWNIAVSLGAGPIGAIIVAAGALVLVIGNLVGAFHTVSAEQKAFNEIQQKAADEVSSQRAAIDTLTNAITNNALSLDDRKKALNGLIAINPAYLSGLTLENVKTAEGKKIIDDYVSSLDRMARAKATQSLKEDFYKKNVEAAVKAQQAAMDGPKTTLGFSVQTALITSGLGAGTGLSKSLAANEDVKKTQEDINALNAVSQKQIDEENKLIDAQQKKMVGLSQDSQAYKNEQVKLNDLIATRNVLIGIEATSTKAAAKDFGDGVKVNAGLIDELKAKIKVLDDARGGLTSVKLIDENLAQRKKLQDELDILEHKGQDKRQKKESSDRDKLLKELTDFQFELQQVGKQADESEIDRITKKYNELMVKATRYGLSMVEIEKAKSSAIAYLLDEEQKKRDAAISKMNKAADEETYKNFQESIVADGEKQKEAETKKYGAGITTKKQFESAIRQIDIETYDFQIQLANSFAGQNKQAATDAVNLEKKKNKQLIAEAVATREQTEALAKREQLAKAQLDVLKTNPDTQARLEAQKKLLKVQEEQELFSTDHTQSEIAKIIEEYRQKQAQTTVEFYAKQVQQTLGFIKSGVDIISKLNDAKAAKEKAALDKELKANDTRRASIKKLEDSKVISSQEATRRLAEIQAEEDKKKDELDKKQQARAKRIAIAQAIINGAMAVTSILAAPPGAADVFSLGTIRAIEIGLAIATTAAEIKTISDTKYGKGGKLTGPSHSNGGMPVINPVTGHKEAEVEGGEYIISKSTVANNRELADALLHSSMYKGGMSIKPFWQNRPYRSLDYPGISSSMQKVKFATGGVFPGPQATNQTAPTPSTDPALVEMLKQQQGINVMLMNSVDNLNGQLKNGIRSVITRKQLQDDAALDSRIKKDAEFK